ncbi:MAG TPA: hypothetical protein VK176_13790, partial [Phycisphaerales bacterium]|nr:hypothetical protein [Phycisphaerales bacterium]
MSTTPTIPTHTIPEDQLGELLFEFIHSSTPTDKILAERGIKITTFIEWLTTTRAREIFRALQDLVQLRTKVLTANNALRAIIALGAVVSTPHIESPRHAETI